jgi:hypothetical protein
VFQKLPLFPTLAIEFAIKVVLEIQQGKEKANTNAENKKAESTA